MSIDWWRTIQAWMDTDIVDDPNGPKLIIVTTQRATPGSAASALRPGPDRNPAEALRLLCEAARNSTSKETANSRQAFLELTPSRMKVFVGRMHVLDGSPAISDLDHAVRAELSILLPMGQEDQFMHQLWGWWYGRVIELLCGQVKGINGLQVKHEIDEIKAQYSDQALPKSAPVEVESSIISDYLDHVFVHQMRWVEWSPKLIELAIIDYYRAYVQAARWIEDRVIGYDEIGRYERRLQEEWEREREYMLLELAPDANDDARRRAGAKLLKTLMSQTQLRIRTRYDEAFFPRGKCHELADLGHIGWHPEFQNHLESLLLKESV
ncbi:ABC-three component system protein [Micromonospora sp. S-DT3-3-22]|uniref:ABC-three component system protein n=1 Tax=Micromonospora sp. S-DT3-3-22 TaxID=2755359 RepID=UPI00188FA88B|nr:ABC-three component system protein [Micromonospora sp. S-DT3-3-22]